ncbi:variable surface protein [Plasmodium gonderi]|uniref:Variable surface protein n=1 Tax=Plasmodium gonderi TaxID=77519 RepID=A0A1Y1JQV7_PLAGO|nr:variable surface protein [Plasmodium gonderi]GAW84620.1 variable surface protein [Plasmodium gonderi]
MTPAEINKTYIKWIDYSSCREFIDSLQISTQNSSDIESFINESSVTLEHNEHDNFIKICQEIRELFNNMSSNDTYNNRKCCNYINYYIRHQIKVYFPEKEKEIFNHLKNYIESNKNYESYKTCVPKIEHIGNAEFNKLDKLFELYDLYESILNPDSEDNDDHNDCEELNDLINDYNEIIKKYNEDINLHKELYNLRCSIENNELINNNCKSMLNGMSENKYKAWNKNECNESQEKLYLKQYSEGKNTYLSNNTYIQPLNINVIIASTLSSVFLGTVLYCMYKINTSGNYLRNHIPRMKRMNRNIKDGTYQQEMCNRKHYHRNLKEKCYNVSYVSERKY